MPDWYLFGLQLGVSRNELDMIKRQYPWDNHMCKVKMFEAWLRVDTNATCGKLARALVGVGKRNIAEALCIARGTYHMYTDCCGVGIRVNCGRFWM